MTLGFLESNKAEIAAQMSQQRLVQLSTASLALVFCRDEESSRAGGGKYNANTASGQEIFADFKAQNQRSFWNKRLVKAVAEVYFQGWMENLVLFVQGNANNLEVLREAWMRRALRSPKGFVIKAVGDLSPVQMSPVPQSQFIPLAEVLCSVISDMNSAHVTVNQEALINHMSKAHPGMTIPTQDILYNALGSLIKERKIYHTGEGYFIVTPQTYFITNSLVREKSWWTSGDNEPPSPPPITYLLSNQACVDTLAPAPLVAHCKSCSCFAPPQPSAAPAPPAPPAPAPPSVPDQQSVSVSVSECTGKSLKWPRPSDHKPSVQNQSTSTAADGQASEVSKTTATTAATGAAGRKDKDGKDKPGRKFGLSLFRRNGGKKEKPKKEYASFSGQFPPEEWPVRDEDDLNNLPRDLEHAIIRRINPELTVDNLTRHTVLMKKLEERGMTEREREAGAERGLDRGDRGVDKGMSTEILTASKPRHHHSYRAVAAGAAAGAAGRRAAPKASRTKRRAHSSREKRGKSKTAVAHPDDDPPTSDLVPSHLGPPEVAADAPGRHEGTAAEGKCLYKKRINNPFQSAPAKEPQTADTPADQGRRDGAEKEGKTGAGSRRERAGHRSKSWDPHRARATANAAGKSRMSEDGPYDAGFAADPAPARPPDPAPARRELPADYGSAYPQSSTLRIDDKVRRQREAKSRVVEEGGAAWEREGKGGERGGDADRRRPVRQTQEDGRPADPAAALPYDPPAAWPKPPVQRRSSLRHADANQGDARHRPDLLSSHQRAYATAAGQQGATNGGGGDGGREPPRSPGDVQELTAESDVFPGEKEAFIDGDHRLYQGEEEEEEEEEEDACSSLYLSEEGGTDGRAAYQMGAVYYRDPQAVYRDRGDPDSQSNYRPPHNHAPRQPDPHAPYSQARSLHGNWDSTYAGDPLSATQQDPPLTSVRPGVRPAHHHHHHHRTGSPGAQSEPSPRRGAQPLGERRQDASLSLENLEHAEAADSSIFDYCQTSEVDSDAETLHKSADEGDGQSARWAREAGDEEEEEEEEEEEREVFESLGERGVPPSHGAGLSMPSGARGGETAESLSITGDSGIDSPRTRVSLASNNTVILEGLKRRGFLQNLEKLHSKSTAMRPQSSLLQLTPVMNV